MRTPKLFIGEKLRELRDDHDLTQAKFAEKLGLSTSYLNQLENNQRHVTASVLLALAEHYSVDIASLSRHDSDRLLAALVECFADPLFNGKIPSSRELKLATHNAPNVARSLITMHQALRRAGDQLAELDDTITRSGYVSEPTPYEEVRDYFHFVDNYVDALDKAGEKLANLIGDKRHLRNQNLLEHLQSTHKVKIGDKISDRDILRHYDPERKLLRLNGRNSPSTDAFQIAHQIALLDHGSLIDSIITDANFRTPEAKDICRLGLANYFAGATLMPYSDFHSTALSLRHDLVNLSTTYDTSIEQVAHRLSTLQRTGKKGVPIFFARIDRAGNITKRHSATKLQFARFGSACPLWNAHKAFESPGQIITQLAETPDAVQYMCLASTINKSSGGFSDPVQTYALALGCEVKYMDQFVYSDRLNAQASDAFEKIGISCRICERMSCHQRAQPPLKRAIDVSVDVRRTIPYTLSD
ncbi:MAG: DUF2083 domain-containing protein [Granulosicoccus sp.]|nr:DUF2083 domain-containing protein [Granulosicoccus sp.]